MSSQTGIRNAGAAAMISCYTVTNACRSRSSLRLCCQWTTRAFGTQTSKANSLSSASARDDIRYRLDLCSTGHSSVPTLTRTNCTFHACCDHGVTLVQLNSQTCYMQAKYSAVHIILAASGSPRLPVTGACALHWLGPSCRPCSGNFHIMSICNS